MAGFFRSAMQQAISTGAVLTPEDRTHAAATHLLGAIAGVFSAGFVFPVMATTLVLVFHSSRHPFVLFHVNQAAWFQAFVSLVALLAIVAFVFLYMVTCGMGLILLPLALFPWALSVVLPMWLAYRAYYGEWAGYPVIGDFVLDQESPFVDA